MPHQHGPKRRLLFEGPDIPVMGSAVSSLALLLHEFSPNAAKYGALSLPSGCIEITCTEEGPDLHIVWRERGGPAVQGAPPNTGFADQCSPRRRRKGNSVEMSPMTGLSMA
jgi:two-component sensor histidine kinase